MKQHFTAVFLSISVFSLPLDAATSRIENKRNYSSSTSSYRKDDTLDLLKKLSTQMKSMQDQLSALKAAQSSLTSDSMVKNLSPKVRKMEVQVDYLEKKVRDLPSYNEFKVLLSDYDHLKSQLDNIGTSESSTEEAISALSPVLTRMQKQIMFLYQKYKTQAGENYSLLEDKCSQLHKEIEALHSSLKEQNNSFSLKLNGLQQNLIGAQALKQNMASSAQAVSELQASMQMLSHEVALMTPIAADYKSFKEEMLKKSSLQMKGLSILHKKIKDLSSCEKLQQIATRADAIESALQEMQVKQESFVKIEMERSLAHVQQQFNNLATQISNYQFSFHDFENKQNRVMQALSVLNAKIKNDKESNEAKALDYAQNITNLSERLNQLQESFAKTADDSQMVAFNAGMEKMRKQILVLYKGIKQAKADSEKQTEQNTALKQESEKNYTLASSLQEQISELKSQTQNFAKALQGKLLDVTAKLDQTESHLSRFSSFDTQAIDQKFDRVKKQVGYLYNHFKALEGNSEKQAQETVFIKQALEKKNNAINSLFDQINQLHGKAHNLGAVMQNQFDALSEKMEETQKELALTKTLDTSQLVSQLDKMKKQVGFLYNSYKKLESSLEEKSSLTAAKNGELEDKIALIQGMQEKLTLLQEMTGALNEKVNQNLTALESKISNPSNNIAAQKNVDEQSLDRLKKQVGVLYRNYKEIKDKLQDELVSVSLFNEKLSLIDGLQLEIGELKAQLDTSAALSSNAKELEDKIVQLQRQNAFLYSRLKNVSDKEGASISNDDGLMQKIEELSKKVESLSSNSEGSIEDLSSMRSIAEELKKRDEEIAKLKRRVMYLYSKSRGEVESNASSQILSDKFTSMKEELESKLFEQLDNSKKDRQVIQGLLEKVATLEEALKMQQEDKEMAKEDVVIDEEFQG